MSVGIPPFLTLSEKPSALRDKSGSLQNPNRLVSPKIRHWNSISIPQRVAGEHLHAFFASGYIYVSFQEFIIAAVAVIT